MYRQVVFTTNVNCHSLAMCVYELKEEGDSGDTVYSLTHYILTAYWCYINSPTLEMERLINHFIYCTVHRYASLGPAPHWASSQAAKNGCITRYMVAASSLLQ